MNRPAADVCVEHSPHFQAGVGNEAETLDLCMKSLC